MARLRFFDVKKGKSFTTDKYEIVKWRTNRGVFEVAKTRSPWGNICYRILRRLK